MTEEEKEAIEHLNKRYKFMSENPLATNVFTTLDVHNLGIILNYIDKLQKENEELKDIKQQICNEELINISEYFKLKKENEELKEDNKMLNEMVCLGKQIPFLYTTPKFTTNENFISKDKIRNKIKELEEIKLLQTDSIFMDSLNGATSILKELLGDDK